ncbi:ABC1 kinase family protein [Flagellimonas zhangzhouensis]|uniref:Predicted unusual protein kinase regulating ubiquinone biosynthesis, AarF/ABC1/UbiB family n=1 Tax=Flagellimonas zhangzhouensis TaxID=1073328 RepID=A0A1H2ZA37_9FLAO|nr:AarF/UbiB family protein [Allomuricauda zhangzhouensis]SDR08324.1 Predicted unusual protein kinase regulating ubiquinone biosynthesis, AarF/ABC1/UbiB family [Allomuricauda zhangzhouensis]SDX14185.1 Predicted unusual protein kinase regulating ubiquinone biosynthesis, AarF/ABC1/UbiB family [Allomuricauda zhangzhouensis]
MKTLDSIPTSKIERASKLVKTGVKIGGNYVKYYGKKLVDNPNAKEDLDKDNAEDIYDGLKSLKGSALKVAQMLSMEKNLLPSAYVEKFSLSQFSVPPLSAPLVRKTFKKYLGKYPEEIFDAFEKDSVNAASIGQVHRAEKDGKEIAVKIQYPGVADSISSDLALVKPVAIKMFNLKGKDSEKYFKEVEHKLIEETDYILELEQSQEITEACAVIPNMQFPSYYKELSSERILTMDWMKGVHLGEFTKTDFDSDLGNTLGQALWDFYMFQIHKLRRVHADPHPGNFLVSDEGTLIAIDFGCIKQIPEEFYVPYFELAKEENINNEKVFMEKLYELEILTPTDSQQELEFFTALFKEMLTIFTSPFHKETFDFGDEQFWSKIANLSERYSNDEQIRKMNGNRGSKHFLYINRTFFGLYNLLHDLKAQVEVNHFKQFMD